jgi:hypothetical protein
MSAHTQTGKGSGVCISETETRGTGSIPEEGRLSLQEAWVSKSGRLEDNKDLEPGWEITNKSAGLCLPVLEAHPESKETNGFCFREFICSKGG